MNNNNDNEKDVLGPLAENVVKREYSSPKINFNDTADIPPVFIPPSGSGASASQPGAAPKAEEAKGSTEKKADPGVNPAAADIPDSVKSESAEFIFQKGIDAYGLLKKFAGSKVGFSEKKVKALTKTGQLNLMALVPIDQEGNVAPFGKYVEAFNAQRDEIFTVSEEFKKEAHDPAIRILKKKNAVLTDEQQLGMILLADIGMTIAMAKALNDSANEMLEFMKNPENKARFSEPANPNYSQQGSQGSTQNPPPSNSAQTDNHKPKEPVTPGDGIIDDHEQYETAPADQQPAKGEFMEPEEMMVKMHEGVIQTTVMPEYGDKSILSTMEKLSEQKTQES